MSDFLLMMTGTVVGLVMGFSTGLAAPAHADDQAYLDYLSSHGTGRGVLSDAQLLRMGNGACTEMHQGKMPDDVAGEVPQLAWAAIDGRGIAEA
jgi:hypothetical protein